MNTIKLTTFIILSIFWGQIELKTMTALFLVFLNYSSHLFLPSV